MRVVYLHQYFSLPSMAGGTRSYEMARRLTSLGHEVDVITTWREDHHRRDWFTSREASVTVHWLPVPYSNNMSYAMRMRAFGHFAIAAASRAASIDSDVVFATSTPLTIALPAIYASRRRSVPMVFEVRDLWPEVPVAIGALENPVAIRAARRLARIAYRNATQVVTLSPDMSEGVARSGYPGERISIISNACDFELFNVEPSAGVAFRREHDWLQDNPLVLYAGALGLVNGVGYLARLAAETLRLDPAVRFLVMGSGREDDDIRRLASSLGVLNRNFFMTPAVPKSQVPRIFSAADITSSVVIDVPELWANSANKFFDSLAAGKPIMINHEGWQAELIREHEVGLVIPASDPQQAARMLVERLQSPEWLRSAGNAAARLGKENFDRDLLAVRLEAVLQKSIQNPTRPKYSS